MNIAGNTILITGGGSGIGRGLAQAFHQLGNQVVIAGRRREPLEATATANPGMKFLTLDIESADSIRSFGAEVVKDYPALNVVIHNAGIMRPESILDHPEDLTAAEATIATNLLGPIRLTSALLPHLRKQSHSTIITVSSGLAFVPLTITPAYCATKAAIHSYTLSLRYQLKDTTTEVLELVPPYVQTELMGEQQANDPRAMPLDKFLAEVMEILQIKPTPPEICVKTVDPLRYAAENGKFDAVFHQLNEQLAKSHS